MGMMDILKKYECEPIEAIFPPKYKCCGKYFHTLENLARHIKHTHPDVYEKEFKQIIEAQNKTKEPSSKKKQPRVRKDHYNGDVFVCPICHKPHSEGWILHYDEEHGGDKLVCCACKYHLFQPYMSVVSVPMGGKVK